MNQEQLNEMESWDTNTKRYFKRCVKTWEEDGWSRKVAFGEAYQETLVYIKEKHKWSKKEA